MCFFCVLVPTFVLHNGMSELSTPAGSRMRGHGRAR